MYELVKKGCRIYEPIDVGDDGIRCDKPSFNIIEDCYVDFSRQELEDIDECLGITRGAEAYILDSTFKGAQKIALVGCGDKEYISKEEGKVVVFKDCTFKHGARRMPEVQDGMRVLLINCTIEDWCNPNRYTYNPKTNRGFGAWAHNGGEILAVNCLFLQYSFWKSLKMAICDFLGHMGQTFNDEGILGFFRPKNWIPGVCRGLTSSKDGKVTAYNCAKNKWWIRIENHKKVSSEVLERKVEEWLDSLDNKRFYTYAGLIRPRFLTDGTITQ